MIILDFGSGETCQNDYRTVERMIHELAAVDPHRKAIIKWQLFTEVPAKVRPLDRELYLYAVEHARELGYQTTASVFDRESLDFLLSTGPPFVKIAARPYLYPLISRIPPTMQTMVSAPSAAKWNELRIDHEHRSLIVLCCIAEYPATVASYRGQYGGLLHYGISDHTEGLELYRKYNPVVWEKHYCLPDSTGPDAAGFAIRPKELEEVLR